MGEKDKKENYIIKYIRLLLNMAVTIISIILVIWLGPKLLSFFMPFVIGWVIAIIANPLVRFLERHLKIVRKHSSVVIMILVIGGIVIGGYFLVTKSVMETVRFVQDIPRMYEGISSELAGVSERFSMLLLLLPEDIRNVLNSAGSSLNEYVGTLVQKIGAPTVATAGNMVKNIPNALIQIIVTIISAYFFITDRDKIMLSLRRLIPKSAETIMDMMYKQFMMVLGGYFKAQFKIMGVVALILLIGFLIMHVPYALLLALLISFLDFLPFFGTGTALIPWAVVKLLAGDYQYAVGLFIIYLISQLIRQMIQPKIVGDSMGLNPLLTLLFMYIGFKLQGVAGMILAVPIGMIFIKLYEFGAFRSITDGVRIIAEDISRFLHEDDEHG